MKQTVEVILLGPRKQPTYCYDRGFEKARWYKICYGGNHQVGDGFPALPWYQEAYMCPKQMEVYGGCNFEIIDDIPINRDLVEMEDWINEHCNDMMEICDEDECDEYEEEEYDC